MNESFINPVHKTQTSLLAHKAEMGFRNAVGWWNGARRAHTIADDGPVSHRETQKQGPKDSGSFYLGSKELNLILGEFLPGITCSVRYTAHISPTNNKAYHMTSLFGHQNTENEPYLEENIT